MFRELASPAVAVLGGPGLVSVVEETMADF
jgi:hypothetical protein